MHTRTETRKGNDGETFFCKVVMSLYTEEFLFKSPIREILYGKTTLVCCQAYIYIHFKTHPSSAKKIFFCWKKHRKGYKLSVVNGVAFENSTRRIRRVYWLKLSANIFNRLKESTYRFQTRIVHFYSSRIPVYTLPSLLLTVNTTNLTFWSHVHTHNMYNVYFIVLRRVMFEICWKRCLRRS